MTEYHRTSRWMTFSAKARRIIQPTLPRPCVDPGPRCTGVVMPGDKWDVSHLPGMDAARNPWMPLSLAMVGPAHHTCNRGNGSRARAKRQAEKKTIDKGLPTEGSGWV